MPDKIRDTKFLIIPERRADLSTYWASNRTFHRTASYRWQVNGWKL